MLEQLFPRLKTDVFLHDLVKEKYHIRDSNGLRLNGRDPYTADTSIPRQFAFTLKLTEQARSPCILLLGRIVGEEFVKQYGPFNKSGDWMEIGGVRRRIFYMRHPEHTWRYATAAQLRELRSTILEIQEAGVTTINSEWLDKIIAKRQHTPSTEKEPYSSTQSFVTKKSLKEARRSFERDVKRLANGRAASMRALWGNPDYVQDVTKSISALWAIQGSPYRWHHTAVEERMLYHRATSSNYKADPKFLRRLAPMAKNHDDDYCNSCSSSKMYDLGIGAGPARKLRAKGFEWRFEKRHEQCSGIVCYPCVDLESDLGLSCHQICLRHMR